jgi:hypothetical protein
MKGRHWIICERTCRFASALRVAVDRTKVDPPPRLIEVRSLSELAERLTARPGSLVLVEVAAANLADVLTFIADRTARDPDALFAALLDRDSFSADAARHDAIDALLEAGACEIASSPRNLLGILAVARRHAALNSKRLSQTLDLPIDAWAWSLLPWQSA